MMPKICSQGYRFPRACLQKRRAKRIYLLDPSHKDNELQNSGVQLGRTEGGHTQPVLRPRSKDRIMLQYQLQRSSPWRSVSFQWKTWLVLITTFVLLGLVPYVVHRLMTAFTNPPPSSTFKVATVSFGLLSEILLLKCLSSYVSGRYRQAEQSSFTVQPRGAEDGRNRPGRWDQSESPSAVAGHASSVVSPSQVEERKVDMLKTGCLSYF